MLFLLLLFSFCFIYRSWTSIGRFVFLFDFLFSSRTIRKSCRSITPMSTLITIVSFFLLLQLNLVHAIDVVSQTRIGWFFKKIVFLNFFKSLLNWNNGPLINRNIINIILILSSWSLACFPSILQLVTKLELIPACFNFILFILISHLLILSVFDKFFDLKIYIRYGVKF